MTWREERDLEETQVAGWRAERQGGPVRTPAGGTVTFGEPIVAQRPPETPFARFQRGGMGFIERWNRSFWEIVNVRNFLLGTLHIAEAAMPPSEHPYWEMAEEVSGGQIQPLWEREGREQAEPLATLNTLVDPFTSWEKFKTYAYENPASLVLDATIAFGLAKSALKVGARLGVRNIYRAPQARYTAAYRGFTGAEHAGNVGEMARQYNLWKQSIPEFVGKATEAQEFVRGLPEGLRGFLGLEVPFTTRTYGAAPVVGEAFPGQHMMGRTSGQGWATDVVDWWRGQAGDYTAMEIAALENVYKGVDLWKTAEFNQQFIPLSQFRYSASVLDDLVSRGLILPQTREALRVWREITKTREARLIKNGLLTPEEARARAAMPTAEIRKLNEQFRTDMRAWEDATYNWRQAGAPVSETPPRPINPLTLRADMELVRKFPELFETTHSGRMVSPMYYPHQMSDDLIRATVRDTINRLGRPKIGEFRHNWGELFRDETYNRNVMEALRRNVRRTNMGERDWNIVREVIESDGAMAQFGWKPGQAIPEGTRIIYPEGMQKFTGVKFEEMVVELAERLRETRNMTAVEKHLFTEKIIEEFSTRTEGIIGKGKPRIIYAETADHIIYHLRPENPWFVAASDLGGVKDVWRAFILSFRPAWQAINESTNFGLTSIMGGLEGWDIAGQLQKRGVRFPGVIAQDTVMAEFGSSFGWSPHVQQTLRNAKLGWLVDLNRRLHSSRFMRGARYSAQFNQVRDSFHKRVNLVNQMQREFRSAAAADVGMDIGTRALTPTQVQEISRGGKLMIDTMEEILRGAGTRGQNHFLRDMTSRACEVVYSYNKMTPTQRKYWARAVPFVGWQLFTAGFLLRLPTRFPGRAWLLKSLANMGQDQLENTLINYGIEPDTVAEWDRTLVPLGPPGEDGQVPVIRVSALRFYDMLETTDYVRTFLSHPLMKAILEIGGVESFPKLEPPTTPPDWPEDKLARRNMADILLEMGFGSAYDILDKMVHPYQQYGVGGLVSPHPYEYPGEPREPRDWRSDLMQYTIGVSFAGLDSFEMMEGSHRRSRRNLEGMFRAIAIDLKVVDEDGYPDVSEQIMRQGDIRADTEYYLQYAYAYLQQIENMMEDTSDPEKLEELHREENTYRAKVFRMENLLNTIIGFGDQPGYIQPEMIYAE